MSETIKRLKKMYASSGLDVPVIMASSFPVGAFLAPILAHEATINDKTIKQAKRDAYQFAFGKPDKGLIQKYRGILSHELANGRGAWTNQPGGNSRIIQRAWGQEQQFQAIRMAQWDDDAGFDRIAADTGRAITRAGTEVVRNQIHRLFKARVRYHNMIEITEHIACWPNIRFIVVCKKPTRILRNNNRQLHSTEKLAVKFPDGWGVAAINGVVIPTIYLHQRKKLTLDVIKKATNVEVKRALIELYGYEAWLKDSDANCIDSDLDRVGKPRRLWRMDSVAPWRAGDAINLLEVVNSTPELDGTYKKYYLQVPGGMIHVRHALAWMLDENRTWEPEALIET